MLPFSLLLALTALLAPAATALADRSQPTYVEAPNELLDRDPSGALDEIAALGADGIRILMIWRRVAPRPESRRAPSFNATDPGAYPDGAWARYDAAIDGARARGLKVHVTITGHAPLWATRAGDGLTRPDATAFSRFATAAGRRYRRSVTMWSVWNEPNLGKWLMPIAKDASAAVYRDIFVKTSSALRTAGVRAPILLGELAPLGNRRVQGTIAPLRFLRAVLCLDARYRPIRVRGRRCQRLAPAGISIHPYSTRPGPFLRPADRDSVTIATLGRLTSALDKAAKAGMLPRRLPIHLTEYGVQSFPDRTVGVPFGVQSDYRSMAERIAFRNPRVKSFSQYLLYDDYPSGMPWVFESGLRPWNGEPKPSWHGFRLPLVVTPARNGRRAQLWGLVRAARRAGTVTVSYRDRGRPWRTLGRVRHAADGYWSRTVATRPTRLWRVSWEAHDGSTWSGSITRAWPRQWNRGMGDAYPSR
nr:cellulase family glycosylhydrolase [Conexibacter arvalis]